jgi:uncharacterized integral membrane protein
MDQHGKREFRERLGVYLLGVAIGCMILGIIFMNRQIMRQRRAAQRAAEHAQPAPRPAPGSAVTP